MFIPKHCIEIEFFSRTQLVLDKDNFQGPLENKHLTTFQTVQKAMTYNKLCVASIQPYEAKILDLSGSNPCADRTL